MTHECMCVIHVCVPLQTMVYPNWKHGFDWQFSKYEPCTIRTILGVEKTPQNNHLLNIFKQTLV